MIELNSIAVCKTNFIWLQFSAFILKFFLNKHSSFNLPFDCYSCTLLNTILSSPFLKSNLPFYAIAQHVSVQYVILCLNLVNVRFLLKIHLRFKSLTSMTSSDYICTWMNKSLFEELHKFFDDFLSVDKCRSFKISTKSLNLCNCKTDLKFLP